jgi:hypothetical protein
MPKPVYIVCSLSGAEDRTTGLISLYHVLETLHVVRQPPDQERHFPVTIRTTAVWMRTEEDDPTDEYEFETGFLHPSESTAKIVKAGQFSFEKPIFRLVADITFANFPGPGVLTAIHRIRKIGEGSEWISQEFPILLQEHIPISEAAESGQA